MAASPARCVRAQRAHGARRRDPAGHAVGLPTRPNPVPAVRSRVAEPFKNWVCEASVRRLGTELARIVVGFDEEHFATTAAAGLEPLELKARVQQVGRAIRPHLSPKWSTALDQLVAAMPAPAPNHEGMTAHAHWWPVLDLVERQGLVDIEASVNALCKLTTTFSAEFAIRPYVEAEPDRVWPLLEQWVEHPDPNVRRWLSEGTRSRLPWGMRLATAARNPARGLAIIEALVDDPSSYVRRSVANHLGDVAKDHPDLAVATAKRWLERPSRERLVKHALRDLLKKGHVGALCLFGEPAKGIVVQCLRLAPHHAQFGDIIQVEAVLHAAASGSVRVDVVWRWPGAKASGCQKVFRGETRDVRAGEAWQFRHRLSLRPVSTRVVRAGTHRVSLRLNGEDVAAATFVVEASRVDGADPGV